jgi:hypothetical protein
MIHLEPKFVIRPLTLATMHCGRLLAQCIPLESYFSFYCSSWNPNKATELTEETPTCLQYSNIKLNTSICLSFMCIVCKKSTANLKLTDKLIISPYTSTLYGELCWLTWLQNQEASGQKQRLIVWVLPVTEWLVSNCATLVLIRTYKFMTANRSLPPFRIFVTRSPWRPRFRGTESEKQFQSKSATFPWLQQNFPEICTK